MTSWISHSVFTDSELQDLYRYCLALTHEEDEAYDLLHACYEKFLRLSTTRIDRPFGYFRGMIRNHFIDGKRRQAKHEKILEEMPIVPLEAPSIEHLYFTRDEVRHLLKKLKPEERELLYLWSVEGYTVLELAEHLALPRGTILSKLHRVRKKLQKPEAGDAGGVS